MRWEQNLYFESFALSLLCPEKLCFRPAKCFRSPKKRKVPLEESKAWNRIFPPITMSLQGHHRFTPLLFWILVELLNERTEIKATGQQLQLFHEGFDDTEDVWLLLYVHLCTMTVMLPCLEEVLHLLPSFTVHEFPGATAKCCTDRGFHPPPAHSQFFQGIRGTRMMSESHENCSQTLVSY